MRLTLLLGIIPVISIRRYQTGYELRLLNADDSASSKLINQGRHCARCGHRYVEGFGRVQTIRQQGGVQEAVARGVRAPHDIYSGCGTSPTTYDDPIHGCSRYRTVSGPPDDIYSGCGTSPTTYDDPIYIRYIVCFWRDS